MKIEKLTFKKKNKVYQGEIVWPLDLDTAIKLLGSSEVWQAFKIGYKELAKRRIMGEPIRPRKKILKIDLSLVDDQMRDALEQFVESNLSRPPVQQVVQPSQENAPRVAKQIDQNDSDETQEEALVQVSQNADTFEQDLAKYLASLDS